MKRKRKRTSGSGGLRITSVTLRVPRGLDPYDPIRFSNANVEWWCQRTLPASLGCSRSGDRAQRVYAINRGDCPHLYVRLSGRWQETGA